MAASSTYLTGIGGANVLVQALDSVSTLAAITCTLQHYV